MAEIGLDPERNVALSGRAWHVWLRRAVLAVLAAVCIAALFNVFGQHTTKSAATTPEATLRVDAPPRLRGGLLFQTRFTLRPLRRAVSDPKLVLDENWFENMTLNSCTPQPGNENSRGGRFTLSFPPIGRGGTLTVLCEWQVNPPSPGRRSLFAAFDDGNTRLVSQRRTLTIFP